MAVIRVLNGFDGYMILDTTQTSALMAIGHARQFSIQVVVTGVAGSAVGEIVIQTSNNQNDWCDVNWVDNAGVVQDGYDVTSTDFTHMFDASDVGGGWARLGYNRTSGTGGLTFYVNYKK
jgi:hypothetical protein